MKSPLNHKGFELFSRFLNTNIDFRAKFNGNSAKIAK